MACAPTSCSNSDVARNTAARDCSLRGRPRRICAGPSGELLNVVFISLTIDHFPGLATARLVHVSATVTPVDHVLELGAVIPAFGRVNLGAETCRSRRRTHPWC